MLANNKNLGILYIILGSGLIVLFAGHLLIRFLGTIAGLMVLNYGLQLLHFPPVSTLLSQVVEDAKSQFRRKK
jgi:hypothetical protein